jgi:hypothetical protein
VPGTRVGARYGSHNSQRTGGPSGDRDGGQESRISRFLSDPCSSEQLLQAVRDGHDQHRLFTAEKVLLEQTRDCAVAMLIEILGMASPTASSRAVRLQRYVRELLEAPGLLGLLGLAAQVSQIGCVRCLRDILQSRGVPEPRRRGVALVRVAPRRCVQASRVDPSPRGRRLHRGVADRSIQLYWKARASHAMGHPQRRPTDVTDVH